MKTLYIDRKKADLGYRDGAIVVRTPDDAPFTIPLRGLERVVTIPSVTIAGGLLNQFYERDIGLLVLSGRRQAPGARFLGAPHRDARTRVAQALAATDRHDACRLASRIVTAKTIAQIRLLAHLTRQARDPKASVGRVAISTLKTALERMDQTPFQSIDEIRGMEGACAATYFAALAAFVPPSLGFQQRNRRPPRDPVNACLSLGYTLLGFESSRACQIAGLDPQIGVLHALEHGRDSLALDIMEPCRPKIDRMVVTLFADRALRDDQFRTEADGGVMLGKAGRQTFYNAYENQLPGLRRWLRLAARTAIHTLRQADRS